MKEIELLKKLYKMIPLSKCAENCSACCGVIPVSSYELEQMNSVANPFFFQEFRCPYLIDEKCSCYNVRPLMCRLFGTVKTGELKCSRCFQPEFYLEPKEAKHIVKAYYQISINEMFLIGVEERPMKI